MGANKRKKEKEKQKNAAREANDGVLAFRYSSYIRDDQPKNAVVVRRIGATGEFVKDTGIDRRITRKGAVVSPEVLREAYIVQNFQFILRPEVFYAPADCARATAEKSLILSQGLVDDFPSDSNGKGPMQTLTSALSQFDSKISWRHVIAVSRRVDADDIRCPICFDDPTAPRVTPCGHVFCFHCILRSMNAQKMLGVGYNGAADSSDTNVAPTAGAGRGIGPRQQSTASLLGSGQEYGARPRTCPLCASPIDLQSLRPCITTPIDPLKEASAEDKFLSFSLACRNVQSSVLVSASGSALQESTALNEEGEAECDNQVDPCPPLTAATLLANPQFVPTVGTQMARYSRYAFATTDFLRFLFETETKFVANMISELVACRSDPTSPLNEDDKYQHNALQGVNRHLSLYGYSTYATANCENPTVLQQRFNSRKGVDLSLTNVNQPIGDSGGSSPQIKAPEVCKSSTVQPPSTVSDFTMGRCPSSVSGGTSRFGSPTTSAPTASFTINRNIHTIARATAQRGPVTALVAANSALSPLVWLYKLADGQNVYLHPLNVRMLLKDAELKAEVGASNGTTHAKGSGNVDNIDDKGSAGIDPLTPEGTERLAANLATHLLPTITAKVIDMETFTQTPKNRSGWNSTGSKKGKTPLIFAHVPPHASLTEVFVDLSTIVSKNVLSFFERQIAEKKKDIARKQRKNESETRSLASKESGLAHGDQASFSKANLRSPALALASAFPSLSADHFPTQYDDDLYEEEEEQPGYEDEEFEYSDFDAYHDEEGQINRLQSSFSVQATEAEGNPKTIAQASTAVGSVLFHDDPYAEHSDNDHHDEDVFEHKALEALRGNRHRGLVGRGGVADCPVDWHGRGERKGHHAAQRKTSTKGVSEKQSMHCESNSSARSRPASSADQCVRGGNQSNQKVAADDTKMKLFAEEMPDLTDEEIAWLLREESLTEAKCRNNGDKGVASVFETPTLGDNWGAGVGTAVAPAKTSRPEGGVPLGSKQCSWGSKPKVLNANDFPDLMETQKTKHDASSIEGERRRETEQSKPLLGAAEVTVPKAAKAPSRTGAGANSPATRGWTKVLADPPRRSWKDDGGDDLDSYFPPPTSVQPSCVPQTMSEGKLDPALPNSQNASGGSAWGKKRT